MHETEDKQRPEAALQYAQLGWAIIPVHGITEGRCACGNPTCPSPGKHPLAELVRHGVHDSSTDPAVLRGWWSTHPQANVGVATGQRSGFFALDVDMPDGEDSLKRLEEQNGPLPETVEQATGKGGRHLLFKMPEGTELRNSTGRLGANLDIRGEGGYIVVAPSVHASGKQYTWRPGHGPDEIGMAEAPGWLLDLVKSKPLTATRDLPVTKVSAPAAESSAYGLAALDGEIRILLGTPEGQRNDSLNTSAFKLGQLVASGELTESRVVNTLISIGEQMGLTAAETRATLRSGLDDGMKQPRASKEAGETEAADKPEPPRLLTREIPPGEAYPTEACGPLLGGAVRAISGLVQVPPALAAGSVLAVASLAVQGFANVLLPIGEGDSRPLSLYLITVAGSSDRKSTADSQALKVVKDHEAELEMRHHQEMQEYEREKWVYEKKKGAIVKARKDDEVDNCVAAISQEIKRQIGDPPNLPLVPYLVVQEPTIEALLKLLALGRGSLGLFSTEGGQMVGGYAMQEDRKLNAFAVLSALWDGEPLKRIRVMDGNTSLRGKRFALHLMMQPLVASKFLSDPEIAGQGLLSRMLIAAPESLAGSREYRKPKPSDLEAVKRFGEKIHGILSKPLQLVPQSRNELQPRGLTFTPAAEGIWIPFHDEMERSLGNGAKYEPIKSLAGKMAEHAARIAGILTLLENFEAVAVSGEAMNSACRLAKFYAEESLRLCYTGHIPPDLRNAQRLLEWLHSRKEPLVCLPDIYQRGLNIIRDKATATKLVGILEDHGWVVRVPGGAEIQGQYRRDVWRIITA
ncbi:MAG: DUF3987 domain-containing protein [Candidatus Zixiibacteriota bacterium]|nr:MAG: DUF3987 domain-containing protein [candidate division Zixibacteria bacterium]